MKADTPDATDAADTKPEADAMGIALLAAVAYALGYLGKFLEQAKTYLKSLADDALAMTASSDLGALKPQTQPSGIDGIFVKPMNARERAHFLDWVRKHTSTELDRIMPAAMFRKAAVDVEGKRLFQDNDDIGGIPDDVFQRVGNLARELNGFSDTIQASPVVTSAPETMPGIVVAMARPDVFVGVKPLPQSEARDAIKLGHNKNGMTILTWLCSRTLCDHTTGELLVPDVEAVQELDGLIVNRLGMLAMELSGM